MAKLHSFYRFALAPFLLLLFVNKGDAQPVLAWQKFLSAGSQTLGNGISYDGLGAIYITGETVGSLGGPNAGSQDGFVARYDSAGNQIWIRQFGSPSTDEPRGVSADGLGNVFVAGGTQGALGGPLSGSADAYIANYNAAGNLQWSRQFGNSQSDYGNAVTADRLGNAYVSGQTDGSGGLASRDTFTAKFDSLGNQQWFQQTVTADFDTALGVSADQASVYLTGFTEPDFLDSNTQDYFLEKRDTTGTLLWKRVIGSSSFDQAISVSADRLGNAYVSGVTEGMLGATQYGAQDAFVTKFDANGNVVWTQQLGSNLRDRARAVVADQNGNVYIGGDINSPSSGPITSSKMFVTKLDSDGNMKWTYNFGNDVVNTITGLTLDTTGNIYAVGSSATFIPNYSAFVLKIVEVPEPASAALCLLGVFMAASRRTNRGG